MTYQESYILFVTMSNLHSKEYPWGISLWDLRTYAFFIYIHFSKRDNIIKYIMAVKESLSL